MEVRNTIWKDMLRGLQNTFEAVGFGIEKLGEATDGFGESRLIKGSVYKGFINGDFYGIKKMKWNACEELKIL